ncbi:CRISPR-associated HD domain protein [Caldicellulosiruptor obsidiansis OB47]|uniref:CRISPR-associated HD domain protein n=1 Tax=Caldicellulosiruptor obsidiansis (strain ATCC BAA-2073 / JCM 16842 / OB47) TaxID=608506 RepID=D9THP1_CALOO|nr:CRISPR-associated helicase/endonuclease Cas3 [Caldicellulosiruptor obsidiansis]ADL43516.1 CRISPR-associated HD domain protein [Caldicellulosiruptor obsidiansis OB47]
MERTFSCFDNQNLSGLFSHPGKDGGIEGAKPLEVHLANTSILANFFASEKKLALCSTKFLSQIAKITALLHDIGKATSFFQKYLFDKKKIKRRLTRHSLISAICVWGTLNRLIEEKKIQEDKVFEGFTAILAFFATLKHHGDLEAASDMLLLSEDDIELCYEQIENIEKEKFDTLISNISCVCPEIGFLTTDTLKEFVEHAKDSIKVFKRGFRKLFDTEMKFFFMLNLLYSILLDADKTEAIFGTLVDIPELNLSYTDVDSFRRRIFKPENFENSIKTLRDRAFEEAINCEIDENRRIYTLCLPTGLGKTIISFAFALKLRELAQNKFGSKFRIIYSLPFLSIIEQNYNAISQILSFCGFDITSDIILKHHHLSDIVYKTKDSCQDNQEEIFDTDVAKLLIEGWNSNIIVTTFVQFLESILTNKNSNMRKFHRIANSIIILDEVQAINSEYWFLCKNLFEALCTSLNCYIILSTATMPFIVDKSKTISIVKPENYFDKLCRTELYFDTNFSKIGLEEFVANFEFEKEQTYLFVTNTVSSAKNLYKLINQRLPDMQHKITILTTHIIPKERLRRIEQIKNKKYKIVISTQLIEAGVDVDFDHVIRDIAPLDSIIQAAGRANREGKNAKSKVTVVELVSEERGRLFTTEVYDSLLIDVTRKILSQFQKVDESKFAELILEYYKELVRRGVIETTSDDRETSQKFLEAIYRLLYTSSDCETAAIGSFKLIQDEPYKVDVFVEADEEAKIIWQRFAKICEIKDIFERKKRFLEIRKSFYDYVISVPKTDNIPINFENIILYVPYSQLTDFYDPMTGFKTKGESYLSF